VFTIFVNYDTMKEQAMRKTSDRLYLLDDLLAHGQDAFKAREVQARLGISPSATSNLLRRWLEAGLIERVVKGSYVIRPLGRLGTSAASEDLALAVGAVFGDRPHRIAYRSALEHHDLLIHPARTIQVATSRRGSLKKLSGRSLRQIHESPDTITVGAEPAGQRAMVSTLERSLLDAATRLDLVGGPGVVADALRSARPDPGRLEQLAEELGAGPALRRIGSIADQLGRADVFGDSWSSNGWRSEIPLNPGDDRRVVFRDERWGVRWPDEPAALIG
jgi:predicted transcriptional regulator of viral defense system